MSISLLAMSRAREQTRRPHRRDWLRMLFGGMLGSGIGTRGWAGTLVTAQPPLSITA